MSTEFKIFNDSVHGHIKMHPLLVDIIDTPAFQRLRNLKQMGGGYFVFPGASHNRFEHSIGVAHLAGQLLQSLMDKQKELNIDEKDKLCVQIAGLCHDLGHGPFSHAFEDFMKQQKQEPSLRKWKHEEQSIEMFRFLIGDEADENSIKYKMMNGNKGSSFQKEDFDFIEELINKPDKPSSEQEERSIQMLQRIKSRMRNRNHGSSFEKEEINFIKELIDKPKPPSEQEERSIQMLQSIESKMKNGNHWPLFEKEDFDFIEELINPPDKPPSETDLASEQTNQKKPSESENDKRKKHKSFLYEIVSNKKTGIDVDKMDYFSRDCHHLGMKSNFSHERYVMFARVCRIRRDTKQICMRDKEALNMYELFHVRYLLHNNVYTHRVIKAVEIMIVDALLEAKDHFKLNGKNNSKAAIDPKSFLRLTDDILQEIMRSSESGLESAKDIIKRIEERNLYQFVASRKYKPEDLPDFSDEDLQTVVEEWLSDKKQKTEHKPEQSPELKKKDFIVKIVKLNYGMKEKNPINALRFYSKTDKDKANKLPKEKVSFLLPERFAETKVMLFYKPSRSECNIHKKVSKTDIEAFWETVEAFD